MRQQRRKALNLMHTKVKFVMANEVIHVATKPLIRKHSHINLGGSGRERNTNPKPNSR